MSDASVISVQGLSKAYRIWDSPSARLAAPLQVAVSRSLPSTSSASRWLSDRAQSNYRDFWALREVSFEVLRGECVGIIGRNGSGKSTLLQIIAGTLQPTAGTARVQGRVAALLELGSGFNPEFTGRENVILNGTILGFTASQMEAKLPGIAAFADIGSFLEEPVKTYSSGMMMRLAFAVQTAVEPDILIVDEALSVGDFFFAQKCFQRIRQLRDAGTTILFVSHDTASVRDLCSRALYLRDGKPVFFGETQGAIALYLREGAATHLGSDTVAEQSLTAAGTNLDEVLVHALWKRTPTTPAADRPARLEGVELVAPDGHATTSFPMGSTALFRVYFRAEKDAQLHLALEFKNRHGQLVSSLGSRVHGLEPAALRAGEVGCCTFEVQLGLEAGEYSFQACLGLPHPQPNLGQRIDETPWLGPMKIGWDYANQAAPFLGMFNLPATVTLRKLADP